MFRHLCAGFVALALVSFTAPAFAGIQDFIIRNNGKFSVFFIYVSPTYSEEWEEDVLGSEVLPPKTEIEIELNGYGDHCGFDIMIIDEQENAREYYDVDLCNVLYVDFP